MTQQQCPGCNGTGKIQVQRHHNMDDNPGGVEVEEQQCSGCNGTGWIEGGDRG
ncbi:hypothetical protein [Streptomyces sp. NRRL S-920]|uniref:hypothetical protein n=1 Tax=Streptomyces sp. NRRL S-920 TaxID=1463921 RepID=UPI000A65A4A9|nr:hypothetical protein [Streptomyces sp. NRRL S-920]